MKVSRSVVDDALLAVVKAVSWTWLVNNHPTVATWQYSSKHLQMWSQKNIQPAVFIRRVNEDITQKTYGQNKYMLTYEIWVYLQVDWNNPSADVYDLSINPVMDALDAAFLQTTPDGRFTLNGVVDNARISGKADIADGSTDGQALIVVPVEVFVN